MARLALFAVLSVIYGHAHAYNNYGNLNVAKTQVKNNYDPSAAAPNVKAAPLGEPTVYQAPRLAKPCRRLAGVLAPNYRSRSIKQLGGQPEEEKLNVYNQKLSAPVLNRNKLRSDNETKQIENFHINPFASELSRNLENNSNELQKEPNNTEATQTRQQSADYCKEKPHSKHAGLTPHEIHHLASHEHLNDPLHKDSHENLFEEKSNNPDELVKEDLQDDKNDDLKQLLNDQDVQDERIVKNNVFQKQNEDQDRKNNDETSLNLEDATNEDCDDSESEKKYENDNTSNKNQLQDGRRALNNEPPQIESEDKKKLLLVQNSRVCYACSTASSMSCLVPDKSTKVKYCLKGHDTCITKVTKSQGISIITRDCGSTCEEGGIPGLTPKYSKCSVCHSDLCNGSFSLNAQNSIFLLAAFVFTALKFM